MIQPLDKTDLPWPLLLDADPDLEKVKSYITSSEGIIWKEDQMTLGVLIYQNQQTQFEIMNVAVAPAVQSRGIGSKLIDAAFTQMAAEKTTQEKIIIRTGSITSAALHLYKKKGFIEIAREKDYFLKNYAEPIYEDGRLLKDQVTLAVKL
ncbi:acetyltransferase, GNAT family [Enterococcus faecalis 13-SD-W-01]|nr:acetyltransferase, GNAT family [Enterococcus faecalis 13-SD-W-01]